MNTFVESPSGGLISNGTATIVYYKSNFVPFGPGDIVYNIHKAKRGVLEKVVIKRIKVINPKHTFGNFEAMYVDTLNGLWNESDLTSHSKAIEYVVDYCERMINSY